MSTPYPRSTLTRNRLVPIMITRLMLSLKRAATPSDTVWSFDGGAHREDIRFARRTIGGSERVEGGIAMKHLPSKGIGSSFDP